MILLAIGLGAQTPVQASDSGASDRKTVQWKFPTSAAPTDITAKLRALEREIVGKYSWQVEWHNSDIAIQGKLFDARVKYAQGTLCVHVELDPALAAFQGTIRRTFEKELRKHFALL